MCIEFRKISHFDREILYQLLVDAYSFDEKCRQCWDKEWKEFEDFFFDNLEIADKYGFITVLNGEPIGHISWDPRNRPKYVEIGHNCIATKYKGKGYGRKQLIEAVRRIRQYDNLQKIIVTTNELLVPAQKNYERVGFELVQRRKNYDRAAFSGDFMDYEMKLVDK